MKIGIDAKRIFNNGTGLGVYGRNLIYGLSLVNKEHSFFLYTPESDTSHVDESFVSNAFRTRFSSTFSSYFWRTFSIKKDILKDKLDIYHGISNELPIGIKKIGVKTIVDIHDLCFVHFKKDYSWIDRQIFWFKAKLAAQKSDKIIATSQATKNDIIKYFKVNQDKVEVVYQCCDKAFYTACTSQQKNDVITRYKLPKKYILTVGTIQGRKNQKNIVEAIGRLPMDERIPLVLVGNGGKYMQELRHLASKLNVNVHLLSNVGFKDLPAVYQSAKLFVYPSIVEGFGIPVLEAMASKVPTITSKHTSMAEIIQNEDCLVSSQDIEALSKKIRAFLRSPNEKQVNLAFERALEFSQEIFSKQVLNIYKDICKKRD